MRIKRTKPVVYVEGRTDEKYFTKAMEVFGYTESNISFQWIGHPRLRGKGLIANRSGQWQYRIGDYRLICLIEDDKLVIIALSIGHRRDI